MFVVIYRWFSMQTGMISCNDGFRPVSFYIEALDEDAD